MELHETVPWVWLVLAVVGLALAVMSQVEAVQDFLATRPTNGFRMLAVGDMIQEGIRIVLYVIFAAIGVVYLSSGAVVSRSGIAWALVGAEMLLVVKTSVQISVRRYLRRTTNVGGDH